MKFVYDDEQLTITVDEKERVALAEMKRESLERFESDVAMWDFFEDLISNSELSWISPADTGDLTDAPILGILDYENAVTAKKGPFGAVDIGMNEFAPILNRWGFMHYETTSVLETLLTTGKCTFVGKN